jgi:hypothetical protein
VNRSLLIMGVLCGAISLAMPADAQQGPAAPGSRPETALQVRHQIFVMESVLEQAVQYGAQMLSDQLRVAGMPDMVLLAGAARARGFRLDGYGVFFDLEVPAVRQSVAWSLRMMNRPDQRLGQALNALRGQVRMVTDPSVRANLSVLIAQLESEVSPLGGAPAPPGRSAGNATVSAATVDGLIPPPVAPAQLDDPGQVYTNEVRKALIDAMFDHSAPMNLAPAEWLIIAARADMDRRFLSGDPNDVPTTMVIRVRGADLQAFREGRLSREDAIKRVEVSNF